MTEKRLIQDYIDSIGAYTIKVLSASKKGAPDLIMCLNGEFIAICINNSTKLTEYNLSMIRANNGRAYSVASLDELKAVL